MMAVSEGRRVYIIRARFESTSTPVFKIGVSSGKSSVDRLLQLERSFFMKYRYMFFAAIKRDRPAPNAFAIETELHHRFADKRYYHDKPIDGKDEWFKVEEDELLRAYDDLLPLQDKKKP